jgi:hypothetical protein
VKNDIKKEPIIMRLRFLIGCICLVLLISTGTLPAARIPSKEVIPHLKQIGESLQKGLKGECKDLFVSYLEIFNMYAEDLRGEFRLEEGHILVFDNIRGSFYNGTISGSVRVTLGKAVAYHVKLDFDSVDFKWFAMNFFDAGSDFKGKIKGKLDVSGNDKGDVHGRLHLVLKDGYIKGLPRWFTMFSLINVNPLRPSAISEAKVKLNLSKDKFIIKECKFDAHDYTLTGQGEVGFDGNANIVLKPVGKHPLLRILLPVAVVVRWIERLVWQIHIKGPIYSLQYRILPLYKL